MQQHTICAFQSHLKCSYLNFRYQFARLILPHWQWWGWKHMRDSRVVAAVTENSGIHRWLNLSGRKYGFSYFWTSADPLKMPPFSSPFSWSHIRGIFDSKVSIQTTETVFCSSSVGGLRDYGAFHFHYTHARHERVAWLDQRRTWDQGSFLPTIVDGSGWNSANVWMARINSSQFSSGVSADK